jgi:hypothetical protein
LSMCPLPPMWKNKASPYIKSTRVGSLPRFNLLELYKDSRDLIFLVWVSIAFWSFLWILSKPFSPSTKILSICQSIFPLRVLQLNLYLVILLSWWIGSTRATDYILFVHVCFRPRVNSSSCSSPPYRIVKIKLPHRGWTSSS